MKKLSMILLTMLVSGSVMAATTNSTESSWPSASATTAPAVNSAVEDTTRPGCPNVCQNMTASECKQMKAQWKQKMVQDWQNMTPAQKQKMQQNMQMVWQNATPQEKQMIEDKLMLKWQAMSPADQQMMMQKMQNAMSQNQNSGVSAGGSNNGVPMGNSSNQ